MELELKIKKEDPSLDWKYNHETDACFDIQSNVDMIIPARGKEIIPTGVSLSIPDGFMVQIKPRSGLSAKHGIETGAGVIDSDYTGEIRIVLFNHSDQDYMINKYDRIAQAELRPVYKAKFIEVEELEETERGAKRFGSSGK